MYWSVRRELWENRSIYMAPLIAAGVYLLGFALSLIGLPNSLRQMKELDLAHQSIRMAEPYTHAGMFLMLTAFLVGIFYSLDALHSERRDRSILFWKSLPVSDLTTVLSKAMVPLVVLPAIVFVLVATMLPLMRVMATIVLLMSGMSAAPLWTQVPLFQLQVVLLYTLPVVALWHAPIYAWMLLISAWARRTTFLWAVLPLLAICAVERIAFNSMHFAGMLKSRLFGFVSAAFALKTSDGTVVDPHLVPLSALTPGSFLGSGGLWIGLTFAAIFLAAAVRLRRNREPI
jgi:ABC-2 type transport system permease protein